MIVNLDGVAFHAELDANAFRAFFAVNDDLAGEVAMRLATQKAHDISGSEGGDGGGAEVFVDALQISLGFEKNVRGKLSLIDTQPVAAKACLCQVIHEWVDHEDLLEQRARPVDVIEFLAEFGRSLQVCEPQYLIVAAREINALAGQLATHPLASIDVDLDRVRCPGLHTHMHPAKLGIDQIPIQVQAFAITPDNFQTMCFSVSHHGKR